jgi:transposase InsO family protein
MINIKNNAWGYNSQDKFKIVAAGITGIVVNTIKNYNIASSTFYRWKKKLLSCSRDIWGKNFISKTQKFEGISKELDRKLESATLSINSKAKLIDIMPGKLVNKAASSTDYKKSCAKLISNTELISLRQACSQLGISTSTYYRWKNLQPNLKATLDNNFTALAFLHILIENPEYGAKRISEILLKENSCFLSHEESIFLRRQAVKYINQHCLSRLPLLYEFEKPNDAWCMDFKEIVIENQKRYLCKIIDDNSRQDLAFSLTDSATTNVAIDLVKKAMSLTGEKPIAVKTDRGTQFKKIFTGFLESIDVFHLKSYPYYPKFNAKIERRMLDISMYINSVSTFYLLNINDVKVHLANESSKHNNIRPHKSLGGLTPSKVYHGTSPPGKKPFKLVPVSYYLPSTKCYLWIRVFE